MDAHIRHSPTRYATKRITIAYKENIDVINAKTSTNKTYRWNLQSLLVALVLTSKKLCMEMTIVIALVQFMRIIATQSVAILASSKYASFANNRVFLYIRMPLLLSNFD